jgi:protein TonB
MPAYPSESREKGEEGRVVVSFTVRADGTLADIKVVESSGYARLDEAAMEAVRKSAFTPATRFGAPVESTRKIAFVFKLEEG